METPLTIGFEDAKVSFLRNEDGSAWDLGKLNELFQDRDMRLILQVPISVRKCQDKLAWKYEQIRAYTMKSGY